MSKETAVFSARRIITMNPSRPFATHVAVREGRIVAVGSEAELANLATAGRIDDRFKEKILLPGFVEGHSHIMEGMMWSLPYVGAGDRRSPEGRLVEGVRDIDSIVVRLKQAEAEIKDPNAPLFASSSAVLGEADVPTTVPPTDPFRCARCRQPVTVTP